MDQIARILTGMDCRDGALPVEIEECEKRLGHRIPEEYRRFLEYANGAEGGIGEHGYLRLEGCDGIVDINLSTDVREFAPGLFLFGSDGGGEAYGYDLRRSPKPVVSIPFIPMLWEEATEVADSLRGLLEYLEAEE